MLVDKPKQRAIAIHRNRRMHQKAARRATLANGAETSLPGASAQRHLAGILDHRNVAALTAEPRGLPRRPRHLSHRHLAVAQKPAKLNPLRPVLRNPPEAGARKPDHRLVQQGPPFSSRKSPNLPTAKLSIPTSKTHVDETERIKPAPLRQERCVHMIAAFAGMTA